MIAVTFGFKNLAHSCHLEAVMMIRHTVLLLVVLLFLLNSCASFSRSEQVAVEEEVAQDLARQRRNLIDQLRSEGITSSTVLEAMLKVPRHKFVPPSQR